jgi:hypothetical protein
MTENVLLKLPMLLVAITMYDPNCVLFISCVNICDVNSNPFELLCDFITLSVESFLLNTHCIVGAGLAKMLTVMFKDIPIFRAINSYELGISIFNCGGTTIKA